MLKSMTAYGRGSCSSSVGHFIIEIQSVNRKFLDINVAMPKELLRYEIDVKKWIAQHVDRGQVNVKVFVDYEESSPLIVKPNLSLARQFKSAWEKIADELGLSKESVSLSLFANVEELLAVEEEIEDEKLYREAIHEALNKALTPFIKMKGDEGAVLQKDIAERMGRLNGWMEEIAQRESGASNKYREKLKARLEEILPGCLDNEERLLREVAILAEKVDIAEEVTRFLCHLKHFNEIIQSTDRGGVAKTLEFILQELGREINTIGSKSADIDIARRVVEIKSVLEQVKEQIQNIE